MKQLLENKQVLIMGIPYSIREFEDNSRADTAMGRSDNKRGEISLSQAMAQGVKEETLLHECIHIISDNTCIGLDERQVSTLSVCLYEMLVSNDLFVKPNMLPKPCNKSAKLCDYLIFHMPTQENGWKGSFEDPKM